VPSPVTKVLSQRRARQSRRLPVDPARTPGTEPL